MPQNATEDVRARAWEMYLTGMPKSRIAVALALDRETVSRYIRKCYAEVADERRMTLARKLDEAIMRMRRVQVQAWADHDADEERECQALATAIERAQAVPEGSGGSDDSGRLGAKSRLRRGSPSQVTIRFHSQRAQYLRVILDALKEIARLEGLYEVGRGVESEVVFSIGKRE